MLEGCVSQFVWFLTKCLAETKLRKEVFTLAHSIDFNQINRESLVHDGAESELALASQE